MSEIIHPDQPGAFIGDTWFGDPEDRTNPTHWWTGTRWELDYEPSTPPAQPAPEGG